LNRIKLMLSAAFRNDAFEETHQEELEEYCGGNMDETGAGKRRTG
jgi:hypothetical protein